MWEIVASSSLDFPTTMKDMVDDDLHLPRSADLHGERATWDSGAINAHGDGALLILASPATSDMQAGEDHTRSSVSPPELTTLRKAAALHASPLVIAEPLRTFASAPELHRLLKPVFSYQQSTCARNCGVREALLLRQIEQLKLATSVKSHVLILTLALTNFWTVRMYLHLLPLPLRRRHHHYHLHRLQFAEVRTSRRSQLANSRRPMSQVLTLPPRFGKWPTLLLTGQWD